MQFDVLHHDPDTESLIRKYLNAGAMVKGKYEKTTKGTPQGGNREFDSYKIEKHRKAA